ncbi:MAG: DUF6777 domain-containing protein [Fimbriimonadales bacterium]
MIEGLVGRLGAGICFLAVSVLALASQRAEPNAFLARKADSVQQLVQQVRTDRAVADRFERHFGRSSAELLKYFASLHLARLNQDSNYMVYGVDDLGVIKVHPQRLKAGTRVFADSTGLPILLAGCGNAMVPGSNMLAAMLLPSITEAATALRNTSVTTPDSTELSTLTAVLEPGTPVAISPSYPTATTTNRGKEGLGIPVFLAALGGAGGLFLGGGGSHPGPTPEPATILVMASALVALKYRRKSN